MIKHVAILICLAFLASAGLLSNSRAEAPGVRVDLEAGFRDPPNEVRPSAYWLWLGGHVNRPHVERELKALHAAGVRGLCIFDMGARGAEEGMPPAGPAFMSEPSVEDIVNTWSNRLVGDALLPQEERFCRTNITGSGTPRSPWKDVPLHESGLLGPVRLIPAVEKTIRLSE